MKYTCDWEYDFPQGIGHTSISYLKRCNGYIAAKNGNIDEAFRVVEKCIKIDRIAALKEKYPDCVLLPVISRNKLPMALALSIGLPVYTKIQLIHAQSRKYLNAINRLVHTPEFEGKVRKGISYIIVDDVVTQGGTVSALRQFVVMRGGIVSAVVALAYAVGSRAIAPTRANIVHLISKFNRDKLIHILSTHDICDDFMQLTNSQIRYILRFKNVYTFNEKIDNYIN